MVYRENRRPFWAASNLTSSGMIMETGRNAPCPCGSGKKYKNCCLKTLKPDRDSEWRRLGDVYGRLDGRMRRFTERALGRAGMSEAFDEFLLWPQEETDRLLLERLGPLFASWCLFNWTYDPDRRGKRLDVTPGRTPAELFLEREGRLLNDAEKDLIGAISRRPFSFYEVISCEPGRGFLLKDVLMGLEIDVLERSASTVIREGDILFGRLATVRGMTMLYGCSSYGIPLEYKPSIIRLRKWIRRRRRTITEAMLNEYEAEIRGEYLAISRSLFGVPSLFNTDGEPMVMQTLHYEIDSPDRAFSGLAGLCVKESEAQLRALAKLDDRGEIVQVEIPWTREGYRKSALDSTVLGFLVIEDKTLQVTVNSAARAERIRKEIETRLGAGARFKTSVIQSGEAIMREARDRASRQEAPARKDEKLVQYPEVREHLARMLATHWEGWVNDKIPALGGKTPRQAMKSADGRESVEALLRSAERRAAADRDMGEEILKAIEGVRHKLHLPRR